MPPAPNPESGCPSPRLPLGSAVAPHEDRRGSRPPPGRFSRAPLGPRRLSPGPYPQSGAPSRAALLLPRSLHRVCPQECPAEQGFTLGPWSAWASPTHPGPPGPHPPALVHTSAGLESL